LEKGLERIGKESREDLETDSRRFQGDSDVFIPFSVQKSQFES
jgi:hypothetical protein